MKYPKTYKKRVIVKTINLLSNQLPTLIALIAVVALIGLIIFKTIFLILYA